MERDGALKTLVRGRFPGNFLFLVAVILAKHCQGALLAGLRSRLRSQLCREDLAMNDQIPECHRPEALPFELHGDHLGRRGGWGRDSPGAAGTSIHPGSFRAMDRVNRQAADNALGYVRLSRRGEMPNARPRRFEVRYG